MEAILFERNIIQGFHQGSGDGFFLTVSNETGRFYELLSLLLRWLFGE